MYKIIIAFLSVFILTGCTTKSPTQAIVDSGVQQIERSKAIIKNTETLEQCKANAENSLTTAQETLVNAGQSCESEVSKLESDLIRWKSYFCLLVAGIGVSIYFLIIKKLRKGII